MRISNPPDSRSLMATARSFGNYDLPAALADLIDNSIKAKSTLVDINFVPNGDDVVVTIRDNGCGMSGDTLVAAMRPASSHPEDERSEDDLGRFGWGMKSASLSQARIMKVVSWSSAGEFAAGWNVDDIADWEMDYYEGQSALDLLDCKPTSPHGTEVRWENVDRLLRNSEFDSVIDALSHLVAQAMESLALTFHRYLSGELSKKLTIKINGSNLPTIDPFLKKHPATQCMGAESIRMSGGQEVSLQPFVMPHFSKLTSEEQRILGGPEGMVRNQGFYVYRNFRLIIHGTWFKLMPHRDISQLTRIQVDLPNSLDHDWKITLDKSGAQLPSELRKRLQGVVRKFNQRSVSVHRKKGVSINNLGVRPVWNRVVRNGQIKYSINRDHPVLEKVYCRLNHEVDASDFETLLTLLESYFPVDRFLADSAAGNLNQAITSDDQFRDLIMNTLVMYVRDTPPPYKSGEFLGHIKGVEPFVSHWSFVCEFIEKHACKILE